MRLRIARFLWLETVDQFDFECQPSLDRKVVKEVEGFASSTSPRMWSC